MNAARRARQKARNENRHEHLNRAARTLDDGTVVPCRFCCPVLNANEKTQSHGGMLFRPVRGHLRWGQQAASQAIKGRKQAQAAQTMERLEVADAAGAVEDQAS